MNVMHIKENTGSAQNMLTTNIKKCFMGHYGRTASKTKRRG